MMFIQKNGVRGGESTIYDRNEKPLLNISLKHPTEIMFVNDVNVMHGVSPVQNRGASDHGTRDILVLTFLKKSQQINSS